jgi:saccharopine dehydrogenase (NAD+, L-lysine-forming)
MGRILIIGAGGVAAVAAHKCAQNSDTFSDIWIASRTIAKCEVIQRELKAMYGVNIHITTIDADDTAALTALLEEIRPELVMHLALPYQDLSIMEACLAAHVPYLDTANYEPLDTPHFEYRQQWAFHEQFRQRGLMALLGSGFDPGVTNIFCAYANKHLFDSMSTIDILDCNAGSHGKAFATNFNPEINIREVTQQVRHWHNGKWIATPAILEEGAVHFAFEYPEVGTKESYLLYHEELESLAKHFPEVKQLRFWMTFSENYLTHLKVLQNVGMTRIDEVDYEGHRIVPLKFLKALLPDPSSLAAGYSGKTVIGCIISGMKDGQPIKKYIYNICDHAACWQEVRGQAISYTTAVPAVIGAKLMLEGKWHGHGVFNVEQMDPDPFMNELMTQGLPWQVVDFHGHLPNGM